jgi:hypothetical protein
VGVPGYYLPRDWSHPQPLPGALRAAVLPGKGDRSFSAVAPVGSQPGGVFLVDLNRDGKLDPALANVAPAPMFPSCWATGTGPARASWQTRMDGLTWQPATIRTTALSPYPCRCRLLNLDRCKHHRPQGRAFGCPWTFPGWLQGPRVAEQSATKYTGSHLFVCVIKPLRANILRVFFHPGQGPLL